MSGSSAVGRWRVLGLTIYAVMGTCFAFATSMTPSAALAQTWDWQLSDPYDLSVDVEILVIEPDDLSTSDVAALKARGIKPICYLSVGTWENYRDDADQFPQEVIGNTLGNWPNEKYLDIRRLDVVLPLMRARLEICRDKGFVGFEPDNIDAYENDNGFGLQISDGLKYVRALHDIADDLGLEMGQKNGPEMVPELVDILDFMLVEECFEYRFCEDILPYRKAGKPVLSVEFEGSNQDWAAVCKQSREYGFSLLVKDKEVRRGGQQCWGGG